MKFSSSMCWSPCQIVQQQCYKFRHLMTIHQRQELCFRCCQVKFQSDHWLNPDDLYISGHCNYMIHIIWIRFDFIEAILKFLAVTWNIFSDHCSRSRTLLVHRHRIKKFQLHPFGMHGVVYQLVSIGSRQSYWSKMLCLDSTFWKTSVSYSKILPAYRNRYCFYHQKHTIRHWV